MTRTIPVQIFDAPQLLTVLNQIFEIEKKALSSW
jgi:hypothetical protein